MAVQPSFGAIDPGGLVGVDSRLLQAARSLHLNRRQQAVVNERIERAEVALRSFLVTYDLPGAEIGVFTVQLADDGVILVARRRAINAEQLKLFETEPSQLNLSMDSYLVL